MTQYLTLSQRLRRNLLAQAALISGIREKAIEKDWWVTLSLKALFTTPYAQYCIFKGGTSLSKGWKLIERFSEDVDIALEPQAFGMTYKTTPSHSYVKKLKREGCKFTSTELKQALENAFIELGVPKSEISIVAEAIEADRPDKDPQTLFIRYQTVLGSDPYLADEVRIEFGVRSLKDPFSVIQIKSILGDVYPNPAYQEEPFEVSVVDPMKTLLEKMFLLHEKFTQGYPQAARGDRQSRHLYDIVSLIGTAAGKAVLEDTPLFQQLLQHRKHYVRINGIDYDQLMNRTLRFVPTPELLQDFESDYKEMQRSMIYGNSPNFKDLVFSLKYFNARFLLAGFGLNIEQIEEKFVDEYQIEKASESENVIIRRIVSVETVNADIHRFNVAMYNHGDNWMLHELGYVQQS
ncbi:nucleotidyl transferase AbiEii/AbiGii toxin family protein [Paraflavitalea sp. CAU 1676]|uniref:nucleotidyl transferase AbiEii/AbiGii toxin family protein n=1 Tax=Paraflavitalea sp. CAU 1676 TaxID=3032598 RepID=UPI0023DA74F6|nr:nucleotidyl transferase AbiEii/AbiGii toxin family protein [Paraflavitalea sp. CAU 1676]MDF2189821.1 nucleotidyl transferase AbiEii/AbiGii toxin family protein [Paraflavitalea sp. CAU 1676]